MKTGIEIFMFVALLGAVSNTGCKKDNPASPRPEQEPDPVPVVVDDPVTAEYLLPQIINRLLGEGRIAVQVLPTGDHWFGVTYKEDREAVAANFRRLTDEWFDKVSDHYPLYVDIQF